MCSRVLSSGIRGAARAVVVLTVACGTLALGPPAWAQTNEILCNQDLAKVSFGLLRAYSAHFERCIRFENYPDCPDPAGDVGVVRAENKLADALGPDSHCSAAVETDGAPVSSFGPTTCPAAWNGCDALVPSIDTLDDLERCLRCVHYGTAMRYRALLALPDAGSLSANDRKCLRATEKAAAKAYLKAAKEVVKCGRGAVKPFNCPADDGPGTRLGKALERIARKVGRCRDEAGTRGAISAKIREVTRHAIMSPSDYTEALEELSRCMSCIAANLMFGQAQDCAAFSGLWRCGEERPAREGFFYVANEGDDTVTFFDDGAADANYLNGTLADSSFVVGAAPSALAVNAAMNRVYVANRSDGTVTYLEGTTGAYAAGGLLESTIVVGTTPVALAFSTKYDVLFVVNQGDDSVTLLDGADGSYVFGSLGASTVAVGTAPSAVELSPDDAIAYVTNFGDDTVTYLDAKTGTYLYGTLAASTFPTGAGPSGVAASAIGWGDSRRLAVSNKLDGTMVILDGVTGMPWFGSLQNSTFPVGDSPGAAAFVGGGIYVADDTGNTITTINAFAPSYAQVGNFIAAPSDVAPAGPGVAESALYVTAEGSARVYRYDIDAMASAALSGNPVGVAVNEAAGIVYVTDESADTVTYLDATSGAYLYGTAASSTFAVGSSPAGVAVNETAG
ncbi:MAG: hypothetical protein D6760_00730, partial [Deltaproteobacteria bacterium]